MYSMPDSSPWFLQWDESMSVGIPAIDEEHKHFIGLINTLNKSILGRHSPAIIRAHVKAIVDDAREHFSHEEALFKEWNYPDSHRHAKLHAESIEALQNLSGRFLFDDATEYELIDAGLKIKHALVEHLLTEDMQYRDFYRSKF